MKNIAQCLVLVGLFGSATSAMAEATQDAATTTSGTPVVQPAPSANKLVADLGVNVNESGPSLAVFAGFQHAPIRVGAWLDGGLTWYDWTNFYGAGIGPVIDLPLELRATLLAGVGWQTYTIEDCSEACKAAGVDESRIAYAGRVGLGHAFPLRRAGTNIVVTGWFTANYADERKAALTAADIMYENRPASTGGFRPGGMLTVGLDFRL